jgi:hypothetical protein
MLCFCCLLKIATLLLSLASVFVYFFTKTMANKMLKNFKPMLKFRFLLSMIKLFLPVGNYLLFRKWIEFSAKISAHPKLLIQWPLLLFVSLQEIWK